MRHRQNKPSVTLLCRSVSLNIPIKKDQQNTFNCGYLFLQSIYYSLHLDNICRNIKNRHDYEYDLNAILSDLIYARFLNPTSKLSSFKYCHSLLEQPTYHLHDIYRALTVLAEESDYIQAELYRNSNYIHKRNTRVLYYDCTNYYFEIEQERGDAKYGKNKENKPKPIVVQMNQTKVQALIKVVMKRQKQIHKQLQIKKRKQTKKNYHLKNL